jgi:putative ABC transport system substrate-binding protein
VFIGGVAGGLLASAITTFAQQTAKIPRIGILANRDGPAWDGFRRGLRELGYTEGRNIALEGRWAEGRIDRFQSLATELVQMKVDLIVTSGVDASFAAKQATSLIPIVMATAAYPDKVGLVESLAHPGANITGLANLAGDLMGKRLELLKQVAPKISRVAVMWNPGSHVEPIGFRATLAAAAALGLEIQSIEVRTPDEHAAAFATMAANRPDALLIGVNPVNSKNVTLIADFALKNRIPSIADERSFAEAGVLVSYGPSFIDTFRQAATYVDKILKGAKPADLPIQQPTLIEFVINLKTAKAIGVAIPQSLLLRAEVI